MASTMSYSLTKRCAVVTGANKGIGLEICRQLACNGITVVLTTRDEKRGLDAIENLKLSGLSDVVFHQLDVTNADSISSLATGKLIGPQKQRMLMVKNELAYIIDKAELLKELTTENYELAEERAEINYHGTKRVTEALLPCLLLSDSGRIVNMSASIGRLEFVSNERAIKELSNIDSLSKDGLDELVNGFLKDFKEGLLEAKGWPTHFSAYIVSKAAVNAHTRIIAKENPNMLANCVCPGFVKTDMNSHSGVLTVEDGARGPVMLALLHNDGPTGFFFDQMEASSTF